jgi:predicted MPP superfamily phosphohydrolase
MINDNDSTDIKLFDFGETITEQIYRIAIEDLPFVVGVTQDIAKDGYILPTNDVMFLAYLELAAFYISTVCCFISFDYSSFSITIQLKRILESAVFCLKIGPNTLATDKNFIQFQQIISERYITYNSFWYKLKSDSDRMEITQLISDNITQYGIGHASNYTKDQYYSILHDHLSRIHRIIKLSVSNIKELIDSIFSKNRN